MSFYAKVIADSVSEAGDRLTTLEVRYPLMVHAEFLTHRKFSRNAASARAIPVKKLLEQVKEMPFIPERFGKNQSGMQSYEFLEGDEHEKAVKAWLDARDDAYKHASNLSLNLNIHKQLANRVLSAYSWITVIITATDWQNFINLRVHEAAQPEIYKIASLIREALNSSTPQLLQLGQWHTPYIQPDEEDLDQDKKMKICAARCARVSYLTHDGKRDHEKDLQLFQRLIDESHMSPHEHPARPMLPGEEHLQGNFRGWVQYRKTLPYESAIETLYYEGKQI